MYYPKILDFRDSLGPVLFDQNKYLGIYVGDILRNEIVIPATAKTDRSLFAQSRCAWRRLCLHAVIILLCYLLANAAACAASDGLYRWVGEPKAEQAHVAASEQRLGKAIHNPEYILKEWINLPTAPAAHNKKVLHLGLKEAILLALRYNPNIQNAELDRVLQRYQLRLARNEFELQYALAGTAAIERSQYSNAGTTSVQSYMATPELHLKNKYGSQAALTMDNNLATYGNYNPLLNFSFTQPILRGFGKKANEASLLDALDNETLNKLTLKQSVIDQITQIISAYRSLVLSGNNLKNAQRQLQEAKTSYDINAQKIKAGQLQPTANIQQSYQIQSLNLMVEQANNDFTTATLDLLQSIGLDPEMKLAVPSDVNLGELTIPQINQSVAMALQHNTQFLALQMALKADERAYEVAKNQQLWQLDLNANVSAGTLTGVDNKNGSQSRLYSGRNLNESAGVTLKIPLHDIARRSQLITAKIKLEKDRLTIIATKRALITTIKNTIHNIQSQAKQYELAVHQVDLAQQSYALEKKKLQAGITSALDVNNTQNQLILSQMGLISAKIAYLNQVSALERILGTTLDAWHIQMRYAG